MSDSQWSEHFFHHEILVKVVLSRDGLAIHDAIGVQILQFDFSSRFRCNYDLYGNMTSITVEGDRIVHLGHDNPTILGQWQQLLAMRIHKTDFGVDYEPREKVGEGLSASVFAGIRRNDKTRVSVKVFSKVDLQEQNQLLAFKNQVEILKRVGGGGDNYFPRFIGTYVTDKSYYLVYSWCQGLSLRQWMQRGLCAQKQLKHIIKQISQALMHLKGLGIAHRDIKPDNIIYESSTRKIKIVDFGFATDCSSSYHVYPNCGTPGYAAPEVLDKHGVSITPEVDVFSLGVTLYYMVTGKLPYSSQGRGLLLANRQGRFYV